MHHYDINCCGNFVHHLYSTGWKVVTWWVGDEEQAKTWPTRDAGTFHSPQEVAVTKYAHFLYSSFMWAVLICSSYVHALCIRKRSRTTTECKVHKQASLKLSSSKESNCKHAAIYIFLSPSMSFQTWSSSFHSFLPRHSSLVPVVPLVPNFERGANPRWPQVFRWSRWVEWSPGCEQQRLHQLVANDSSQEASMPCSLRKSWWRGDTEWRRTTPNLSGVCVKTVQPLKQTTNDKTEKNTVMISFKTLKQHVICCKSECIKHMLRNQCFVNIRSTYCKTYYKNSNCMSIHLYKSFLQEEDEYKYIHWHNQVYPIIYLICL